MKTTRVEFTVPELHFLLAVIGELPHISDETVSLLPNGIDDVLPLMRKLAVAHDSVCNGKMFVPIVDAAFAVADSPDVDDVVAIIKDALSQSLGRPVDVQIVNKPDIEPRPRTRRNAQN